MTSVDKMSSTSRELRLRIQELKDSIRRKYSALRNNDLETQRKLAIQYKPLIKPLRTWTRKALLGTKVKQEIKTEPKEEPQEYEESKEEEEDVYQASDVHDSTEEESDDENEIIINEGEEEDLETIPSVPTSDDEDDSRDETPAIDVDEMLAKYLQFIVEDKNGEADFTYGIVYGNDGWRMGRYPVQFVNNDIVIQNRRYKGTPGLFELIFKKHPSNVFNEADLKTYKAMLVQTRAHVGRDGKVISSRGYKYTNIISNMFPPKRRLVDDVARIFTPKVTRAKRTLSKDHLANEEKRKKVGEGVMMMRLSNSQVDYRHWDDPNELCERLFLLIASKEAGNTSHDAEIISILEELKEAGVIKGFENVHL